MIKDWILSAFNHNVTCLFIKIIDHYIGALASFYVIPNGFRNCRTELISLLLMKAFLLKEPPVRAFQDLKQAIEGATVLAVYESDPFEVETDASLVAIAAMP